MERLTEKSKVLDDYRLKDSSVDNCQNAINKLGEYENLEEQGLLLRLPCKVGDTVYSVTRDFISEYTICSIEKYNEGFIFNWRCKEGIYVDSIGFKECEIGKTVFLTQAEAEQKLKEMEV